MAWGRSYDLCRIPCALWRLEGGVPAGLQSQMESLCEVVDHFGLLACYANDGASCWEQSRALSPSVPAGHCAPLGLLFDVAGA